MNKLKTYITSLVLALGLISPLAVVATTNAQFDVDCGSIADCADGGAGATDPEGAASGDEANERVSAIIETVINVFSIVVGVVSVIMIIIGGLKYITSGGDSGNVTGAKNTILYAIIGLVVVALAQVIVRFVLQQAIGDA